MSDIFKNLSSTCVRGMENYCEEYLSSFKDVFPIITDPSILKSHISAWDYENAESLLRFSLVFNDLSLFTWIGRKEGKIFVLKRQWFESQFGMSDVSVTASYDRFQKLGLNSDNLEIDPAFMFPTGYFADEITKKLQPFIESGKLLIQPKRLLLYLDKGLHEKGGKNWQALEVSLLSPLDNWEIVDEQVLSRPIPISFDSNDHLNKGQMFEITIPYLKGVDFQDLFKILEDEGDLVSGLRLSIKQAIKECGDAPDPRIVVRDVVDPKVDALNRKFKSTVNSHFFRVAGAAIGTVALAYTAVSTSGLSSSIATICGSGGLSLLGKEYSIYREKLNELKNDPHYFLWRCKNVSRRT